MEGIERLDSSIEEDKDGDEVGAVAAENLKKDVCVDEQPESDKENLETEQPKQRYKAPTPKSPERRKRHSSMPES